jgi:ATP-binding cassette subfamily C (CFTR/MRP) protein 1
MAKLGNRAVHLLRRAQVMLQADYSFYDASNQLQPLDDLTQPLIPHTLTNLSTNSIAPLLKSKPIPSFLDHICHNKEGWGPLSPYRDLDFTPCFQDVALTVAPAALLIFFASINIAQMVQAPVRTLSRASHRILILKDVLLAVLSICAALELSLLVTTYSHPFTVLPLWASIASLASYILAFPLQHINHTRARRSSTILCFFWLYHILASLVRLRTLATYPSPPIHDNIMTFVLQSTRLSLVLIIFTLECVGIEVGGPRPSATLKANGVNGNGYSSITQDDPDRGASVFSNLSDGSAADAEAASGDPLGEKECPENVANIFSRLTFFWLQPMMTLGSKKFLTEDDMWTLPPGEDAENLGQRFEKYYAKCRTKDGGSKFWTTMFYAYGGPFMFAALLKACQDILAFAQPQLLRLLLQFVQSRQSDDPQSTFRGYIFSALLFIVATIQTSCLHAYFQRCFTTGMRVRAGLVSAIFKKSLRLSNEDRTGRATGDIVNLMSVDASRLQDLCTYGHVAWSALLQMTLAFVSLYNLLGWPSFIGVAIMIVSIPINTMLARYMRSLSERMMKVKDRRTRLMNEILTNIKSIKLFAWEEAFTKKLYQVRNDEELALLKKTGRVNAFFNFFWTAIPFLVSLSTFIVYSATTDKPLTADIIFPALSLYQLLSFPLARFAGIVAAIIQALVSAQRLKEFLDAGELDPNARKVILPANPLDPLLPDSPGDEANQDSDAVITMRNAEFKWSRKQPVPTLSDIDLTVEKGELLAVLGRVGDGKSSLLSAILGEMYRSDGQCIIRGRTAYFTQGGWCMGASIRDNILFGLKYEPDFYQRVLEACALPADLAILPDGDMTEVGEKGVSLSGGQRARVALARACYARADIYLLDDPLAAVDAHVGAHIFKQVIGPEGLLKTKTRILTTNAVSFLPECSQIVSLRRGVFLQERGTYEHVMELRGDIFNLINGLGKQTARGEEDEGAEQRQEEYHQGEKQEVETLEVIDHDNDLAHQPQGEEAFKELKMHRRMSTASMRRPKPLTKRQIKIETIRQLRDTTQQKEMSQQGSVSREVYKQYTSSASTVGVVIYIIAQIMTQVLQVSRDVVLKQWGTHNSQTGGSREETRFYLTLYGLVGISGSIAICIAPFVLYTWLSISSAKKFHDGMFRGILLAPLQWFETIPTGRLLNLFSRDVNVIDEVLPRVLNSFVRTIIVVVGVLVVISVSVPPFLLAVVPLWFIYRAILKYYLATSRELKRLDAVSKSPIFTWFQESLGGLSTIRAFGQETRFLATSEARVDRNQMCYFPSITCNRWLAVRVEFIGALVILLASASAVTLVTMGSGMDAGLLGLMMSQALSTTQTLNWVVRSASEVEQNIVSVERVLNYSDTESEAAYTVEEKPPTEWPTQGKIEFRNYSTRYRKDLDMVLKNVSLTIQDRERIAVVGRTGAGKSSLTLALFRIIEPAEGTILIDDYDCSKLGLKDLRSNIAIIPQDPQLWEGTLRDNIDPTGTYNDEEMWKALTQARLKDHIMSLEGGLDAMLTEGASNFSSGQRQLLCVARALLRGSKILVLDEATSSVDLQSDALIQDMIRNELSEKTLITIAHRLWTIISYDRVAVFEQGKLAEFDTPLTLYDRGKDLPQGQDPAERGGQGLFYSMCEKAGISREEIVKAREETMTATTSD